MSPTQSARTTQSPLPSPASRLREARRCLDDDSDLPEARLVPLVGELIARSWVRSRAAGLPSSGRMPGAPHASAAQLARAMHRQYELMSHAQPVMDYVGGHLAGTQSLLILADAQGMVLRTLGDDGFASRAERVALRPGAQWAEQYRGTNAIGTALAEGQPVVVHGAEHYLDRNGFLTCAAAPAACWACSTSPATAAPTTRRRWGTRWAWPAPPRAWSSTGCSTSGMPAACACACMPGPRALACSAKACWRWPRTVA